MEISKVQSGDLNSVINLIEDVSFSDILPHLNDDGKSEFTNRIIPDVKTTFYDSNFQTVKLVKNNKIVGFVAIRDENYLTHLFIAKSEQGQGFGRLLLENILSKHSGKTISLRSSVNAVSFYESCGFNCSGPESQVNGLRFVPMQIERT